MSYRTGLAIGLLLGWGWTGIPTVTADDWPRFRGVSGLGFGHNASIPLDLDESSALWEIPTKGHGHSSPVIFGTKLFYTVAPSERKGTRDLVCISTVDGKELWRKRSGFAEYMLHQFNSAASTSATVDAERVYLWWNDGKGSQVFALDHDGVPQWEVPLGPFDSQHGCGSSVALAGDVLLVQKLNLNDDSFVAGLEPATGKVLWKKPIPEKTKTPYITPIIRDLPNGGKEALFAATESGLFSVDVKTGEYLWKFDAQFAHRVVGSPVVSGDYIFASCGGGGGGKDSVVIKAAAGASAAEEVYRPSKQLPYVPTGLGIDGKFFLISDGGVATCYDAKSGDLLWRERLLSKCFASPVAIGNRIYAFGRDGGYKVYKASAEFEVISSGKFSAGINTTPAIGDGKLFVRTDEKILCFQDAPNA